MWRNIRRSAVVVGLAVGTAVVVQRMRVASSPASSFVSPAWPTFETVTQPVSPAWVVPVDGVAPEGYPVKANDASMIYHVPGGRFYERTRPERCYADTADAIADGYRAAKS
jgi:hypothetical protein